MDAYLEQHKCNFPLKYHLVLTVVWQLIVTIYGFTFWGKGSADYVGFGVVVVLVSTASLGFFVPIWNEYRNGAPTQRSYLMCNRIRMLNPVQGLLWFIYVVSAGTRLSKTDEWGNTVNDEDIGGEVFFMFVAWGMSAHQVIMLGAYKSAVQQCAAVGPDAQGSFLGGPAPGGPGYAAAPAATPGGTYDYGYAQPAAIPKPNIPPPGGAIPRPNLPPMGGAAAGDGYTAM